MDKNCIVLFIEIEDYNMMLKLLIVSIHTVKLGCNEQA